MVGRKLAVFNPIQGNGVEAMPAFGKLLIAMLQGLALRREARRFETSRKYVDFAEFSALLAEN